MEIRELYGTNKKDERDGKWHMISDEIGFCLKRFGGENGLKVQKVLNEIMKPYREQVKRGTLKPEKDRELTLRAFVKGCMVDWKGISEEGKKLKFTEDEAVKLLVDLPDLAGELLGFAQDMANYQDVDEVGND